MTAPTVVEEPAPAPIAAAPEAAFGGVVEALAAASAVEAEATEMAEEAPTAEGALDAELAELGIVEAEAAPELSTKNGVAEHGRSGRKRRRRSDDEVGDHSGWSQPPSQPPPRVAEPSLSQGSTRGSTGSRVAALGRALLHSSQQGIERLARLRFARVDAFEPGVELWSDAFDERVEELALQLFAQPLSPPSGECALDRQRSRARRGGARERRRARRGQCPP